MVKRGYEETFVKLFQRGKECVVKIASSRPEEVCVDLIPIIPVRMIEAWMLADPAALCTVLNSRTAPSRLGVPTKAKLVENESDPKTKLDHVIQIAYPHQSKDWKRFKAKLYKELGSQISLERLNEVPSYQFFVRDMTDTLRKLNFIQN
jgi:Domain of unknown function (DUF4276)